MMFKWVWVDVIMVMLYLDMVFWLDVVVGGIFFMWMVSLINMVGEVEIDVFGGVLVDVIMVMLYSDLLLFR